METATMRLALMVVLVCAGAAPALARSKRSVLAPDILRLPYTDGAVYRVDLIAGSPFVLELPSGETAVNVWRDTQYWMAETTEGSSRVVIRPIASSDIVGRKGFIHIEMSSQLRISLKVQVVDDSHEVPAALHVYASGSAAGEAIKRQVRRQVNDELLLVKRAAEEEARAKYEAWKRATLSNLRDDYEWGGDFQITKVVDNRLQTRITLPGGTDKAVIQLIDKAGKAEVINYELDNGVYIIENKVLRRGEKFRLVLGKEKAWVGLK